jgi:RHS repeat-associated protein
MLNIDPNGQLEQVQVQSIAGTTITIGGHFIFPHNSGVAVASQNGDEDTYNYSSSTGRMASFNILSDESGGSLTGSLTWNANGTLGSLLIGDSFNAGGNQTCNFTYDDLARVASDLCGTGSSNYRSTMTYDKYGNITKSSSNGTAPVWPQSGSYSASTNRLSSSTYDSNGSALTDFFHTYTWDGFNRLSTLDTSTLTYDALGKVVETANGGVYTVFEYTPIGSKIVWNQSNTWTRGHLPMPGGTSLDWTPSATYIHHKDWLGSSRITTTAGVVYTDKAFGAYGEDTAQDYGPAVNFNFTGDSQDIATAVYDTPNREYMPYQSRWPNVDPGHHGWNGYAYAANPLSFVDPSGLDDVDVDLYSMNVALYGTEGSGGSTDMGTSTDYSMSASNSNFSNDYLTTLGPIIDSSTSPVIDNGNGTSEIQTMVISSTTNPYNANNQAATATISAVGGTSSIYVCNTDISDSNNFYGMKIQLDMVMPTGGGDWQALYKSGGGQMAYRDLYAAVKQFAGEATANSDQAIAAFSTLEDALDTAVASDVKAGITPFTHTADFASLSHDVGNLVSQGAFMLDESVYQKRIIQQIMDLMQGRGVSWRPY